MTKQERTYFWFVVILIALSRVPFLFYGFGSEEDAWALPLVAERIAKTGVYEVSRLPGHPFQELVYTLIWNSSSIVYNFITLFISTIGIACFILMLKKFNIKNWLWAGIGVAITPIIYINSTNDMDYMWAMGFILIAFYFAVHNRNVFAGLFLACAIGCRITSGAMVIPLCLLVWHCAEKELRIKNIARIIFCTSLFTLIIFIPVFRNYGLSFFTYYDHFPPPSFAKFFYKGVIAVWGFIGVLALLISILFIVYKRKIYCEAILNTKNRSKEILTISMLTIFLYGLSFMRCPLKAAFVIPLIPFVWMAFTLLISDRSFKGLVVLMVISTFTFGINLSDPLRGSKESNFSIRKNIAGQKVAIDPFVGLLMADITKRQQRTMYATNVLSKISSIKKHTLIIVGWWNADLLVLQRGHENHFVKFAYYIDEPDLLKFQNASYEIFFLPEQDTFNDLRYQKVFTKRFAKLF